MARKSASLLPSRQRDAQSATWAAVGIDTSMSSVAVTGFGYDAMTDKMSEVCWAETRWIGDEYLKRLGDASRAHELVLNVLHRLFVIELANVYIAIEEPWYYGATKRGASAWLKQQAEVAGCVKGSLVKYGFTNIYEINNQSWRAVIRRDGVEVTKGEAGKWDVKQWAIQAFGLPDKPDLVKDKLGQKIPRPESGYGAKAKPVQPDDIYDAAACMAWMSDAIEKGGI